jgi:hypothetical protein
VARDFAPPPALASPLKLRVNLSENPLLRLAAAAGSAPPSSGAATGKWAPPLLNELRRNLEEEKARKSKKARLGRVRVHGEDDVSGAMAAAAAAAAAAAGTGAGAGEAAAEAMGEGE